MITPIIIICLKRQNVTLDYVSYQFCYFVVCSAITVESHWHWSLCAVYTICCVTHHITSHHITGIGHCVLCIPYAASHITSHHITSHHWHWSLCVVYTICCVTHHITSHYITGIGHCVLCIPYAASHINNVIVLAFSLVLLFPVIFFLRMSSVLKTSKSKSEFLRFVI